LSAETKVVFLLQFQVFTSAFQRALGGQSVKDFSKQSSLETRCHSADV